MNKDKIIYIPPVLAKCDDRGVFSPENPIIGGPDDWISELRRISNEHISVSFDFFADWSSKPVCVVDEFWFKFPVKCISDFSLLEDDVLRDVLRKSTDFVALAKLCKAIGVEARAILFDAQTKYCDETPIVIFSYNGADGSSLFEIINIRTLKKKIRTLSGGPITIGAKGLIFGTTRLECHLSKTDALWPGDVDLLVFSKNKMKVEGIFEFKKHTRRARASFGDQDFSLYYPRPDARKYNRLAALADFFPYVVPLYLVFYCNYKETTDIIVQQICHDTNGLRVSKTFRIDGLQNAKSVAKHILSLANEAP